MNRLHNRDYREDHKEDCPNYGKDRNDDAAQRIRDANQEDWDKVVQKADDQVAQE